MIRAGLSWIIGLALLASMPASSNYQLHNFGFGSGGVVNSTSTHYGANGTVGEVTGQNASSTNYGGNPGHNSTQQANVPLAPTFTNPSSYYDKLKFVINNGSNPSDATFLIAISSDGFATTQYIQPDDTVSSTLSTSDYQTYASWGGSSGQTAIGLSPSTTYQIKVKASTGKYTETQFGPSASAATVAPSITFEIDISATDQTTSPPYTVNFGSLVTGSVNASPVYIWNSLNTNADAGGSVYMTSQSTGLHSPTTAYTIPSMTGDLSSASVGEGAQGSTVTQASGGPLSFVSPFNGTSQVVGITNSTLQKVLTASAPITSGRSSMLLKTKISPTTPAATDYTDVLTMVAAASF